MKTDSSPIIRGFRPSDRAAVRELCCRTGFLGNAIDPVYEDRELFADFLTTWYTDHEPESSFVLEMNGELCGYLLGSRRPLLNQLYSFQQNIVLFLRALWRRAGAEHSSTKTGTVLHGFPVNRGAAPRPRGTDLPRDWPDIRVHAGGAGAWRRVGHSEQPCHWRQNRGGAGHIEVKFAAEALIVGRG